MQRQTGGSYYNRELAEGLTERGFRLEIVSLPDLPYFAALWAGLFITPKLLLRLARRKYDVVLEDGWAHPITLLFNLASRLNGKVPLVIIVHQVRSEAINPPARLITRVVEKLALSCAQLVISVSAFIKSEVERLVEKDSLIAVASPGSGPPPGTEWLQPDAAHSPLRLLFVGNCSRLKGLDYLIGALSLLRDVELTLDVVGDVRIKPRYYKTMVQQVKALGLDKRVTFHGAISREEMGAFYSRADIFTFPSLYEGFGIVLGEAMHAGLPIVATRTGPIDEIVREGENALIVPPADKASLAGAIRTLAGDPTMRKTFGRRSRELAGSLPTWKQTCDSVSHKLTMIIRKSPGMKQKTKTIPKR